MTERQIEELRRRVLRVDYLCVERLLPHGDFYWLRKLYQTDMDASISRRFIYELVGTLGIKPPEILQRANTIMGEAYSWAIRGPNGMISIGKHTATAGVIVHELAHFVAGFEYNHKDATFTLALRVVIGASMRSSILADWRKLKGEGEDET